MRKIGGKGLFVKELEMALLDGRADIAVHSMKDVPMDLPPGLVVPVICARHDVRDVFIAKDYGSLATLPQGAIVGTASLRRQTQLKALRHDLVYQDLRGNINTRLKRLDRGDFAAIILAAAGVERMGFQARIRDYFSVEDCLPAAGQGALGIEIRADDDAIAELIAPLNHDKTAACVIAERALCRRLNGGCQVPIGAYATLKKDVLTVQGLVANPDGTNIIRAQRKGKLLAADELGTEVAEALIAAGAEQILRAYHAE